MFSIEINGGFEIRFKNFRNNISNSISKLRGNKGRLFLMLLILLDFLASLILIFVDIIWSFILLLPLLVLLSYVIYSKRPHLIDIKPPSGYKIYNQSKAYARISPNAKTSEGNIKLHKILSQARPYPKNSLEGSNAIVWVDLAAAAEKLGRVPESYTYYIEALRNGVPNPTNLQIREKLGIPDVSNKAKYPHQRSPDQKGLETTNIPKICPDCTTTMIEEENNLICPFCGKRFLM